MKLSTPQWIAIAVVAVAFVAGAIVLGSGGGGGGSTSSTSSGYDPVAWCQAASAVSTRSAVLDPTFTGNPESELINLDKAIKEAILVAPDGVGADLARVDDWAVDINAEIVKGSDLAVALSTALGFTDQIRLRDSLTSLNQQMAACGYSGITTPE